MGKQTAKSKLPKKLKTHDIFNMSLLKKDIRKKKQVIKEQQLELKLRKNKKYKILVISNIEVYDHKVASSLPGL